jgi:uncharacterized membrane protein YoaT (DUF817 family)
MPSRAGYTEGRLLSEMGRDDAGLVRQARATVRAALHEFIVFGLKEARACIFPAGFFVILLLSSRLPLPMLARYDAIFLATVALQGLLLWSGIESPREALALGAFHALGLALELFKTHPAIGSWSYPEPGALKVGTVPLYGGFMYAAVGSYMCQAWRIFDLELSRCPSYRLSVPLALAIYLNFFTHHALPDLRWALLVGVVLLFRRTSVQFTVTRHRRKMPLLLAFFLIGLFIWVAENVSTFFGAWIYPQQRESWTLVGTGKISSWFLLVIICFLMVAGLKERQARSRLHRAAQAGGAADGQASPPQADELLDAACRAQAAR